MTTRTNGSQPHDPLDETRDAIADLEGTDWTDEEPSTETHIHVAPGATVQVDQTGKHRAVMPTQPDNEKPSEPPNSKVKSFGWLLEKVPPNQRGLVLAVTVLVVGGLVGLALWKGVVGALGGLFGG